MPGLSMLRWGLIPGWARDPAIAYKLINARAERCTARSPSTGWRHTIETFTILTTAANATLTPIHHRMPVILSPSGVRDLALRR